MKQCNRCLQTKSLDDFHKHKNCADGHLNQCRGCRSKWLSEYRMKKGGGNAARGLSVAARRHKFKRRKILRREFVNFIKDVPCLDCGRSFPPECMDFDHVKGNKLYDVAMLVGTGSWAKLKAEVPKCEIICANCHRIRTEVRRRA